MIRSLRTAASAALLAMTLTAGAVAPAAGKPAPDFTRKTLDGQSLHLAGYHGKVVLLNFWATWCGPCMAEMPKFAAWQTKYGGQGLQVIGISMDDDRAPVDKVYRKLKLTYPVAMGDEHLGEQYGGVLGLPISYLIGTDGKVLARYQGATNLDELEKRITAALPKK